MMWLRRILDVVGRTLCFRFGPQSVAASEEVLEAEEWRATQLKKRLQRRENQCKYLRMSHPGADDTERAMEIKKALEETELTIQLLQKELEETYAHIMQLRAEKGYQVLRAERQRQGLSASPGKLLFLNLIISFSSPSWLHVSSVMIQAGCSFLAPDNSALTSGVLNSASLLLLAFAPVLGINADRTGDFRPALMQCCFIYLVGLALVNIGVRVHSLPAFGTGVVLSFAGALPARSLQVNLSNAHGANGIGSTASSPTVSYPSAYAWQTLHGSGSSRVRLRPQLKRFSTCASQLTTTFSLLMSFVAINVMPLKRDDSSFLGILFVSTLACTLGIACLPRYWLQSQAKPTPPGVCLGQAFGGLGILCSMIEAARYLPARCMTLGLILWFAAVVGTGSVFMYFVEDWTPIGSDAQTFVATVACLATVCAVAALSALCFTMLLLIVTMRASWL